ncbi:MAG: barstar family protein [Nostocoides sp.]
MITYHGPQARLSEVIDDIRHQIPEALLVVVPAGDSKEAAMEQFAAAFDFPAWFGGNLDALEECLTDAVRAADRPLALFWDSVGQLSHHDPGAAAAITAVLQDVAAEQESLWVAILGRA